MGFIQGQHVHVLLSNNERRRNTKLFVDGTVSRIGRKYVYVTYSDSYGREIQYDMDGHEVTDYPGSARRIMTDEQRTKYERSRNVARRFREMGLSSTYYDLTSKRYSTEIIESVLNVLEADSGTPENNAR